MNNLEQPNLLASKLYDLEVSVNVDPENYLPYEVSYEISIQHHRFNKRMESLKAYLCFTRSLLFFDVSKIRIAEKNRLETLKFDTKEPLQLNKKVVYRESNERVALKLKRRLQIELKHYLDYESHVFKMLVNSETNHKTAIGTH